MLRITSAQINPTIGDISGNIALMLAAARKAQLAQSQLIVFPELSLTAYYPGDLLEDAFFKARLLSGMAALLEATRSTPGLTWVVGLPTPRQGVGKPFHNTLWVLKDGAVLLQYHKQLLPTYNVFDERRHFEPGPESVRRLNIGGTRLGFMICEDAWNDDRRDYDVNPFQRMGESAPDLVIAINASPSSVNKREQRHDIFSRACARHGLPLLYVNQVGGHDQLVYDGGSFAVNADGVLAYEAQRFTEDVTTLAFDATTRSWADPQGGKFPTVSKTGLDTMEFYRQQIVLGLTDYARRCGFTKAVVGCSGGIDSALTLALAVQALGAANVVGVTMPSEYSSEGSVSDSVVLCHNLGIELKRHPIQAQVDTYKASFDEAFGQELAGVALENLQARVRGNVLMEYSNTFGHLLLTTGNKSELSVGYCTLYGDTAGGLGLIGDLYKTEVFELCRHLNNSAGRELIPAAIIGKAPSAELAPGQQDTDSLPPYAVLDEVLKSLIEGDRLSRGEAEQVALEMARLQESVPGVELIARVRKMISRNEYKRRQAAPVLRVRGKAFGSGRQMPIAAVY